MGILLEYHCTCGAVLVPKKDKALGPIYQCPETDCLLAFKRYRSDRKWTMRPIEIKASKSGVTAPRAYFSGLLWEK